MISGSTRVRALVVQLRGMADRKTDRSRIPRGCRWTRRASVLLVASTLGGCAVYDELRLVLEGPPEPVVEPLFLAKPAPEPEPTAERQTPKPRHAPRAARLPKPTERPEVPRPEPALVGASRAEALALLGAPMDIRDAAPAKVWEYRDRKGECEVDVYFYLDVSRNEFFALHYDVRRTGTVVTGNGATRCLEQIQSEKP
ncbi:MAG TPA: hypothetical protein VF342_08585 [Alphaproteobacteria bacterium]